VRSSIMATTCTMSDAEALENPTSLVGLIGLGEGGFIQFTCVTLPKIPPLVNQEIR
jgi:hypothetical protein